MNNQMKSKHVLFKSRYITREYTPLRIHRSDSAAPNKQFKPRSLTNRILQWKGKSKSDYTNASQEHCGNWSLKTKKVHAHPANKKEKNYPTAFRRSFTSVSHMWATSTLAIYHCKQKRSTPIHLSRKELSTPLAFRRKIFASLTQASSQHSGHCSRK